MAADRSQLVGPDSVYVWRGFRAPSKSYQDFARFLGTVFVPACALLQPKVGLRAYIPSMVPEADKPEAVPDQTALMFWARPNAHDEATQAIAVRIYSNLHGDVYDMTRSKLPEVPLALDAKVAALTPEQPYYLLRKRADWMRGSVHHLVGARRPDLAPADFLAQARAWAAGFQGRPPAGVDGALLCCGNDYVTAWVHSPAKDAKLAPTVEGLAALTVPCLRKDVRRLPLPAGLWDAWPGLDLLQNDCVNIQLRRPPAPLARPRPKGKR